jgi:hypothetical protein
MRHPDGPDESLKAALLANMRRGRSSLNLVRSTTSTSIIKSVQFSTPFALMASERMQRGPEAIDPSRAVKRRRFQRRNSKTAAMLRSDTALKRVSKQMCSWEKMSSLDTDRAIQLYAMVEKQQQEKNN